MLLLCSMGKSKKILSGDGWEFISEGGQNSAPLHAKNNHEKIIKLRMEKRNGKPTTVLYEFSGIPDVKIFSKTLKTKLGVGGTFKNDIIELQGEHRDFLRQYLMDEGYTVKG